MNFRHGKTKFRHSKTLMLSATMAGWLAFGQIGLAQAPTGGDQGSLSLPRNNVKGGAVAARRPGGWISESIGFHIQRQNTSLKALGGATFSPPDPTDLSLREIFLQELIDSVLSTLDQLVLLFTTAIQANTPPPGQ